MGLLAACSSEGEGTGADPNAWPPTGTSGSFAPGSGGTTAGASTTAGGATGATSGLAVNGTAPGATSGAGVGTSAGTSTGAVGGATSAGATAGTDAGGTGAGTTGADPGACAEPGLDLDGLMYSPGGTLLPFPCKEFHPTTNNPYAVRCVDAWPWYETEYPGDEFCILPPEPGKGIQIGVHPQGADWYAQVSTGDLSGYDSPTDEFLMSPGEEEERNFLTGSPNEADIKFYRSYVRMRAGSHHMILSAAAGSGAQRDVWTRGSSIDGLFGGTSLPGAQRPDENVPKTLEKPAEDMGLYSEMGPNQDVTFNMHHFNSTQEITLKEAWENLWFEDDATIKVVPMFGMPFTQVASTFATPGQEVDIHHQWSIGQDVRLVQLFGHRHVWTTNFSAWVEHQDGSSDILYQSFDWFDQPTYRYDSITANPVPAPEKMLDGGFSGHMVLKAGDELHFNCHMNYTDERAAAEGAPTPGSIGPLRFANQAFEGEMCILFGSTAGRGLGSPSRVQTPVPDFASID